MAAERDLALDAAGVRDAAEEALSALKDAQKIRSSLTGASKSVEAARDTLDAMVEPGRGQPGAGRVADRRRLTRLGAAPPKPVARDVDARRHEAHRGGLAKLGGLSTPRGGRFRWLFRTWTG